MTKVHSLLCTNTLILSIGKSTIAFYNLHYVYNSVCLSLYRTWYSGIVPLSLPSVVSMDPLRFLVPPATIHVHAHCKRYINKNSLSFSLSLSPLPEADDTFPPCLEELGELPRLDEAEVVAFNPKPLPFRETLGLHFFVPDPPSFLLATDLPIPGLWPPPPPPPPPPRFDRRKSADNLVAITSLSLSLSCSSYSAYKRKNIFI